MSHLNPLCSQCIREGYRARGCTICFRISNERKWIRKLVRALIKDGAKIAVDYQMGDELVFHKKEEQVMSEVHACDEEFLYIKFPDGTKAMVYLVYGNADDGSEVICDCSMSLEPYLERINYFQR